jgi:hypothetical protein
MKKQSWFERLANAFGGGAEGARGVAGSSKHERGKRKPRGWHTALRRRRKRQRQARLAHRYR